MNDATNTTILKSPLYARAIATQNDQPAEVPAAEAERYLRDGNRVLELARRRVHELDTLISGHTAELARLRDIIARLEALRDG